MPQPVQMGEARLAGPMLIAVQLHHIALVGRDQGPALGQRFGLVQQRACARVRISSGLGLWRYGRARWARIVATRGQGIVNLTADTRFPGIFLDTHVPKYKELADR